ARDLPSASSLLPPPRPRAPSPTLFPYTPLFRSPARAGSRPSARRARAHPRAAARAWAESGCRRGSFPGDIHFPPKHEPLREDVRSEEHTSELQSPYDLVCRLLLEKKKITPTNHH